MAATIKRHLTRCWPRSSASSEGHDKTLVIEHPEEVYQSRCAVTIRQLVKEPEVFLKQGALSAWRVHCCAAALARAALVHISGATLSAACSLLVTLRVEFARDQKFLEGA